MRSLVRGAMRCVATRYCGECCGMNSEPSPRTPALASTKALSRTDFHLQAPQLGWNRQQVTGNVRWALRASETRPGRRIVLLAARANWMRLGTCSPARAL